MKIIFAGTPEFAAAALGAVHAAGHEIALVLTQPDRPAGRGLNTAASAVKRLAQALGLPVAQPATLKNSDVLARLRHVQPEAMVVAAYGLMLPVDVLKVPVRGCLNIHASLLPRWRGAAPIQRALLAGDCETGVSIMQMEEGLDTGPVMLREAIQIASDDTAQTLHDRLSKLGARLIQQALAEWPPAVRQDGAAATYAAKINKGEARIDWREPAQIIERKVRAFDPTPGASTGLGGTGLKIWRAAVVAGVAAEPGTVQAADSSGITVACGAGGLRITELQRAGGRRVPAGAFLSGSPVAPGERFAIQ